MTNTNDALPVETLIKQLRYQGRQYSSGVRGGSTGKHMLTQAADLIDELRAALAATSKPEPATPPASTPEVVARIESPNERLNYWHIERLRSFTIKDAGALITLQSHLDAIAKKDAALKVCVEAMVEAWGFTGSREIDAKLRAAITQAQRA